VKEGRFREDLYYRLNVISVAVPPLRARAQDVPLLAERFLAEARARAPHSPVESISPALLAELSERSWAGNVRELQSAIERLEVLGRFEPFEHSEVMLTDHHQAAVPAPAGDSCRLDDVIRRHVESVLDAESGNKARAAKVLGVDLSTLYRWRQKWHR
jgi:two-component system response regulator HydG